MNLKEIGMDERSRSGIVDDGIFFMQYDEFRQYFTDA